MEAVFMGASQSRNPNLATVFYRLGLVESYGTGIRKIRRLYSDFDSSPVFRTAEGVFTVEMKNRNSKESPHDSLKLSEPAVNRYPDEPREKVMDLVKGKGEITRKDVENAFGVGSTKAYKILKQLCADGVLVQVLNGNKTIYKAG